MKAPGLSDKQKEALMDLLVVGMYAHHNLAFAKDACVGRLLDSFGFPSDYERQEFSDAAFTRASRHADSPEAIRAHVNQLAGNFPTRELQRDVYNKLNDLLTSDGKVTTEECQLLAAVREAFKM